MLVTAGLNEVVFTHKQNVCFRFTLLCARASVCVCVNKLKKIKSVGLCVCLWCLLQFKQLKNLNKLNKLALLGGAGFVFLLLQLCVKNKLKMVIFIILHVVSKNNQVRDSALYSLHTLHVKS